MIDLPDNSKIELKDLQGPNWTIKMPSLDDINSYNMNFIRKRENNEIRQLFRKTCKISKINYFGTNNKGLVFPLLECITTCNYCGKEITIKRYDYNKILNKESLMNYCDLNCCNKVNIVKIRQYWEDHPDEICKGFKNFYKNNPEKGREISLNNCKKMNQFLDKNPDIRKKNINLLQEGSKKWRDKNYSLFIEIIRNNLGGYPSFKEENNILYFYNKDIKKYVLWEEYKKEFNTQNTKFKLPDGFKLYPTFRSQDSEGWNGARGAFEQNLIDNNIGWFVYIKFDENNNPLVAGKSGSLYVNKNGSDISFSTNIEDGPARRYLQEEGITWNRTQIAIMKCNNEEEAYKIEKEIQKNYNLFGS